MTSDTPTISKTDTTELTTLRPRLTAPPPPSSVRSTREHELSREAAAGLDRVSGGRPAEELVLLAAASALTLARAEGRDDVALAVDGPFGRVGCRVDVSGASRLADLVLAVDARLREASSHGASEPVSGAEHGLAVASAHFGGPQGTAAISISLESSERPDGHIGRLVARFDEAVIEPWFAESLLRALDHVLGLFTQPGAPAREAHVLSPDDDATTTAWERGSFRPAPAGQNLLSAFREQVAADPTAVAVVDEDGSLDYGELAGRASRVAARLFERGVQPGDRVALAAGKSAHAITAILGILEAGAAYVPLDSALPAERLRAVLADAGCAALITVASTPGPAAAAPPSLPILDAAALAAPGPAPDPTTTATRDGDDVAYVIYTSGSTGVPKGVVVTDAAICSYLAWKRGYHDLGPQTRLLQIPSLSFDSSVSDVFSVLGSGGALYLLQDRDRLDPRAVRTLGQKFRITHVTLVPSLYRGLIEPLAECPDLHLVTVAGEAMPPALAARHRRLMPEVRLVNEYGPTENSVGATAFDYGPDPVVGTPIGRPIGNTVVEVLDAHGRRLPPGFAGEIHLSGPGLATGYLNRPEDTDRSFAAAPTAPGGRRYATGDRAWWRPDGSLEFLGRADGQVKIRGHRVELGDVEAALCALPGVEAAAAVPVAEPDAGASLLVGYVIAPLADTVALRASVQRLLPEHMVPHRIVALPVLPLNANGKADRAALAARAAADVSRGALLAPDEGPDDEGGPVSWKDMAQLYAEVLGLGAIGPDDDFFALGGHSLRAVELLLAVETRFGGGLAIDDVFAAPTPAKLAARLSEALPNTPTPAARQLPDHQPSDNQLPDHLPRAPKQDHYPLTPAQRHFWTRDRLGGEAQARCHLVEAFWIDGPLDADRLFEALQDVAMSADLLRARFIEVDGEPRIRVLEQAEVDFEQFEPAPGHDPEQAARELIEQEFDTPFDLAEAPPFRAALMTVTPDRHLFLLTIHHIVGDADSSVLLTRRIFDHLRGVSAVPAQAGYLDYAQWAATRATDERLARGRRYWLDVFADGPVFPLLPADGRRGAPRGPGARLGVSLSTATTAAVRAAARGLGVTDFAFMLAGAAELLHRLTGVTTIDLGTPASIRTHPDCAEMIGPFVNLMVLRVRLDPQQPFAALATAANTAVVEALEYRDHPFEDLIAVVPGARDGRSPLRTVEFSLDAAGAPGTDAGDAFDAGPELRVRRAETDRAFAPAELNLHVDDGSQRLGLHLEYDSALFSSARAERILRLWADLVERSAADPSRVLATTPLPDAELADLARFGHRPVRVVAPNGAETSETPQLDEPDDGTVAVVDAAGRPVPVGVPGDVVIDPAGPGGSREPTGWSGVWQEDGTLRLRGRSGRTVVTPRGPVDPAEAELLLHSFDDVAAAEVAISPQGRLRARVVPQPGASPKPGELRGRLRRALPARLVPGVIDLTDAIGGVDMIEAEG